MGAKRNKLWKGDAESSKRKKERERMRGKESEREREKGEGKRESVCEGERRGKRIGISKQEWRHEILKKKIRKRSITFLSLVTHWFYHKTLISIDCVRSWSHSNVPYRFLWTFKNNNYKIYVILIFNNNVLYVNDPYSTNMNTVILLWRLSFSSKLGSICA